MQYKVQDLGPEIHFPTQDLGPECKKALGFSPPFFGFLWAFLSFWTEIVQVQYYFFQLCETLECVD